MVIGHITWWPLTLAEQTNVMLDIKPAAGHRMLIQSYPGGIESGTDWYQNDAGVVLTETTINQTPFSAQGTPIAFRARMAIQYGGNIDEVVKYLGAHNNGLYTNEWLIGDAKNNEIAMYELGTNRAWLWRSSKDEWFGGTPGFYWGDNNPKDLDIRLENYPDPKGGSDYIPYVPYVRDLAWLNLYQNASGSDRRAVRISGVSHRASGRLEHHGRQGCHLGHGEPHDGVGGNRKAQPARVDASGIGLCQERWPVPFGYALFRAAESESLRTAIQENEKTRLAGKTEPDAKPPAKAASLNDRLWKGWVLPASDADTWFCRRRGRLLPDTGIGRRGEAAERATRHVPQAETRSRKCHDPVPTRAGQGRFVPRFPTAQDGRRRIPEANGRVLRGQHHEDRDGAVVPRQSGRAI